MTKRTKPKPAKHTANWGGSYERITIYKKIARMRRKYITPGNVELLNELDDFFRKQVWRFAKPGGLGTWDKP